MIITIKRILEKIPAFWYGIPLDLIKSLVLFSFFFFFFSLLIVIRFIIIDYLLLSLCLPLYCFT